MKSPVQTITTDTGAIGGAGKNYN